jgi:putative proteasome-type protease
MTYCVALRLDSGILFASDSRTNAGVDHVATFCKMKLFEHPNERTIVILTAGNLSVTQSVINILEQHRHADQSQQTIWSVASLYDVAVLVGEAMREVQRRDGPFLGQGNIDASASLLVGGQIKGEDLRLFNIYPQGNFIEATSETLYFQLGEGKYGKPVLDRVITPATNPIDAIKCVLVSFDSTIRSNISVGLPIDVLWYPRDSLRRGVQKRIVDGDPYFGMLRQAWGAGLRRVFGELANPDWMSQGG